MRGKLIVIEGLDGSGKKTQTKMLYDRIKEQNKNTYLISFPDYKNISSALVKMYLNSELGDSPTSVNAYAASSFFAVDRYVSYKKTWEKLYVSGYTIIADRYTTSNPPYQMSKLPENEWNDYMTWLYDYEYNKMGLPKPDKVIFLDVPIEVSQGLIKKRYLNDVSKKDLHERDINFLKKCKKVLQYVSERDNWHIVNCTSDGEIRDKYDIHKEIVERFFI